jgi:hypothetical protein
MSIRRTNYIKPERIPVEPVTVKKSQQPIGQKPAPQPQPNRMSIEEKRSRMERIRQNINVATERKAQRAAESKPNYRPVYNYGKIDPIWKGETVYIVAGGASLKGFDFKKLNGKLVIAINKAFMHVPNISLLYWTDSRFYNWYKREIDALTCIKVTPSPSPRDLKSDIIHLRNSGGRIIDMSPEKICSGNNSGFGAINLALKLGASKIYLLGYDMKHTSGKSHFHDGYPSGSNSREHIYKGMVKYFEDNMAIINQMAEVYNTNPQSELKCFKFRTIEAALIS